VVQTGGGLMAPYFGEVLRFVTYDGLVLTIPSGLEITALSYGGFGAPPTDFMTRRGYKQNGMTELGFQLNQRSIAINIHANPAKCSRVDYWNFRQSLNNYLRPNRGGPIQMELVLTDGSKKALIVRANPGFLFPPANQDDNSWLLNETLEFIAFDPLFFDPDIVSDTLSAASASGLIFPITFDATNIVFGPSGISFSKTITYPGTWKTYPTFTISGPYEAVTIENVTTGIKIFFNIPIGFGEQRILDLTPGNQSLTDSNGLNCFGDLGPNSNLVDFCIEPDPIVPGGVQIIQITILNLTSFGSIYSYAISHDGARRFYRCGELSGTVAYDSGVDDADGTYLGGLTLGAVGALVGDTNTAIGLEGTDDHISIPFFDIQNKSFAIEAWFRPDASPPFRGAIIGVFTAYAHDESFYIEIRDDGSIYVSFFTDDLQTVPGLILFGGTQYYHLVVEYDVVSGNTSIFLNSVLVGVAIIGPFVGINPIWTIGADEGTPFNFFKGNIDEVAIYHTWLTQEQITTHYQIGRGLSNPFAPTFNLSYYNKYFGI
jgi:hypothetical protein